MIGARVRLPDGPTVTVTEVTEGEEYGEPVLYVTGTTSLGQSATRWIERARAERLGLRVTG